MCRRLRRSPPAPSLHIKVYPYVFFAMVGRTNVVVDDKLVARVMRLYGLRTKREAIDFALRRVTGSYDPQKLLALKGIGWAGDLQKMRRARTPRW